MKISDEGTTPTKYKLPKGKTQAQNCSLPNVHTPGSRKVEHLSEIIPNVDNKRS